VAAVELRLPPGEDRAAAAGLLALAPGDRVTARALRRTVQRLYQTGRYRQLTVLQAPAAGPPEGLGEAAAGEPWVTLVVVAEAVRRVAALEVSSDGPAPVDVDRVRTLSRLRPGEPFDEADLAAAEGAIAAELAHRGWRGARVSANASAGGNVAVVISPGDPTRIREVTFTGDPGPATGPAGAALRRRVGAVLDEEVLLEDVRALRVALREAGHGRARVAVPVVRADGLLADVEVRVEAGPRIEFAFRGNAEVDARVLRRELGLDGDQPLDPPAVEAAAERIRAFYRARGHALVRVEVEEQARGAGVVLVFHVEEGVRYRLGTVTFEGKLPREEEALRARLAAYLDEDATEPATPEADRVRVRQLSVPGAPAEAAPPEGLTPSRTWDGDAWDRAIEKMVDLDRGEGWLEAIYLGSTATLDAGRRTVDVSIHLRQGPRFSVESISFEGNRALGLSELARESRLAPGDPLVFERVEETRTALLRRYLAAGRLYARVEARETVDHAREVAALRFVVEEGPEVRIGRVVLSGNRRTRDDVVREALEVVEGDVYEPEAMARSQAALLRLGVFRSVELRLQEAEVPGEVKDLAVELGERPYATLSQGFGYSTANGPRTTFEYARPNLLGRALELGARVKVNYPLNTPWSYREDLVGRAPIDRIEGRADVGLRSQRLGLPVPAGARTDLVGEILHRKAYDLKRVAAIAGLDLSLSSWVTLSLQYELEVDDISKSSAAGYLTQADLERLRFDEGVTTLHSLRPSVVLDHRDNAAHPHRGWLLSGSVEYARSLGEDGGNVLWVLPGSDIHTNMLKLQGTGSAYFPLGGSVIAMSLRFGRVLPLDPDSQTIIPKRFFLGGASTMRGFGEEEMIPQDLREDLASEARHCATSPTGVGCTDRGRRVVEGERPVSEGGEAFLLAKGELRLPLSHTVEAGLFVEFGNLWLDPRVYRVVDLRANVGLGVRFITPIGPAALDVGFNVQPDHDINERWYAPHFTIGLF
jgi:outer membrane protein assembly complex protein YaeT